MIHFLTDETTTSDTYKFTDPFRYIPHPLVIRAAEEVIEKIDSNPALSSYFSDGKMLGVLVCHPEPLHCHPEQSEGAPLYYISAFSGSIAGQGTIDGFVPPIYDLTEPNGEFRKREAEISAINQKLALLNQSDKLAKAQHTLVDAERNREKELGLIKRTLAAAKEKRKHIRATCTDPDTLADLIKESQHEKTELRRLKHSWNTKIAELNSRIKTLTKEIEDMKRLRATMSESLQEWIFRQYIVHNALGEIKSIADIFTEQRLVPPGGTGECAAPKLLEYAYRNNLKPIAMGEFWYGASPDTAVRTHGHFYPSCTSKCGPLLEFMTTGLDLKHLDDYHTTQEIKPIVVFEDNEIVIAEKPSGMPSVPGLDGRLSLQEWLEQNKYSGEISLFSVHRLDMDTSGVIIFAKSAEAACILQRQFEEHSVKKTYIARIYGMTEFSSSKGAIDIPLSADYDERPRQKVDIIQGKPALTEYKVVQINTDGTADLLLYPMTGRTHQLRVHCAHHLGLGCPILGDLLYGGHNTHIYKQRLHLHALSITFIHPHTGKEITITSQELSY